jgi:PIN domain nuclease of toxin-antitoxin system
VIVLDTHVLVSDALDPRRLSRRAQEAIAEGQAADELACSDISLWEIAMLMARGRLRVDADATAFLEGLILARALRVLAITPAIAVLAQSDLFSHGDPADRIIAATALARRARLVSADRRLRRMKTLKVIW